MALCQTCAELRERTRRSSSKPQLGRDQGDATERHSAGVDLNDLDGVRAYRPSPQAYTPTVEIPGLNPADVCMVAAHNDLAAARRCGLTTAFIVRPTEHGPAQTSDLHAEQAWDFAATDLNDLATQLGCPT